MSLIRDYPFYKWPDSIYRPTLHLLITNPHNGLSIRSYGLLDTGSDECAIPALLAKALSYKLHRGEKKIVETGNGRTSVYSHITILDILDPFTGNIVHTIKNTPIDYIPNLRAILIGVKSCLSKFILRIDYPHKFFSLNDPK